MRSRFERADNSLEMNDLRIAVSPAQRVPAITVGKVSSRGDAENKHYRERFSPTRERDAIENLYRRIKSEVGIIVEKNKSVSSVNYSWRKNRFLRDRVNRGRRIIATDILVFAITNDYSCKCNIRVLLSFRILRNSENVLFLNNLIFKADRRYRHSVNFKSCPAK